MVQNKVTSIPYRTDQWKHITQVLHADSSIYSRLGSYFYSPNWATIHLSQTASFHTSLQLLKGGDVDFKLQVESFGGQEKVLSSRVS